MKSKRVPVIIMGLLGTAALAAAVAAASSGMRSGQKSGGAEKVTLKIWDIFYFPKQKGAAGALGRAELAIDRAFMKKYPNVEIDHVGVPGSDFFTDLRKFVASRSGPDVVTNGGGSFAYNAGFIKAMYPMYKLITPRMKAQLGPYLRGEGIGDEAHYSIPNVAGVYAFAYSKSLFKRAKIAAPPVTFAQLLTACKKLSAVNVIPISNGFTGLAGSEMLTYGTTNQVLSPSSLRGWAEFKFGWKDQRILAAMNYVEQMAVAGCFGDRATAATRTDADGVSAFLGGRGAMLFQGGAVTAQSFKSKAALNNVGVFAFPRLPTSQYPAGTPGSGYNGNWSIMNYTNACRTAWNYIQFYSGAQAQTIQWKVAGLLPVNSAASTTATNSLDRGYLRLAANKYGHHGIGATTSAPEATFLNQAFPQLINGSKSSEELASQLDAQRSSVSKPKKEKLPSPRPCVDGQSVSR